MPYSLCLFRLLTAASNLAQYAAGLVFSSPTAFRQKRSHAVKMTKLYLEFVVNYTE